MPAAYASHAIVVSVEQTSRRYAGNAFEITWLGSALTCLNVFNVPGWRSLPDWLAEPSGRASG